MRLERASRRPSARRYDGRVRIDLTAIDGAIALEEGLPRLDVAVASAWLDAHVQPADRDDAWRALVHQWLERVAETLGSPYRVLDSGPIVFLTAQPERPAALLLDSATSSFQRVAEFVGPETAVDWVPLLAFSDFDRYYDYAAPFYPDEGHYAASAGLCFETDPPHIALAPGDLLQLEEVAAHELAHAHVSALPLPLWLNEGLAQLAQERFGIALPSPERLEEVRACWQKHGLDSFWTGEAFGLPDDRGILAYDLAYLLVKSFVTRDAAAFAALLRSADYNDAGDAACRAAFDLDVRKLARSMVGA